MAWEHSFSLSPSSQWSLFQLNLPPSCTAIDYHSASCFSLPSCPYHIGLWSPVSCAGTRYLDCAVNRARCSQSSLLLPVSPFLAVALTITSPQLSQSTALWVAISCVTLLEFTIGAQWLGTGMKAVTSYLPEGLLNKGLIFLLLSICTHQSHGKLQNLPVLLTHLCSSWSWVSGGGGLWDQSVAVSLCLSFPACPTELGKLLSLFPILKGL